MRWRRVKKELFSSRVGSADIRRGAPALRETALSLVCFSEKLSPRIKCGVFLCVVLRELARDAKRRACISHAPAKVPFGVYNGFLLEFNSKIVYNRKNNIIVIVRGVL